jgi:hypothetical protein
VAGIDDPSILEQLRVAASAREEFWVQAYAAILVRFELCPRPGRDVRQLYFGVSSLISGLLLRLRSGSLSLENAENLVTDHYLAWLVAACEPVGSATGLSLADAFRSRSRSRSAGRDDPESLGEPARLQPGLLGRPLAPAAEHAFEVGQVAGLAAVGA